MYSTLERQASASFCTAVLCCIPMLILNRAGYFLMDFWKTLKAIKMSQRWLTFYEITNFRAHELGRLPSPAGNSWTWCHHISNYSSAGVNWQGAALLCPNSCVPSLQNREPECTLEHRNLRLPLLKSTWKLRAGAWYCEDFQLLAEELGYFEFVVCR